MKTRQIKEMIKSRYRLIAEEQTRDYHLTHDYYTGRPLSTPYQHNYTAEVDAAEEIAKKDHAYLSELLSPKPTLGYALAAVLQDLSSHDDSIEQEPTGAALKPAEDLFKRIVNWYERYQHEGIAALLSDETSRLTTTNIRALQAAYPHDTAMVQNICIFAAFWLRSPNSYRAGTGTSMLEHVFSRYDAPVFLNTCWKVSATPENVQWLLVYFAYTQGTSLKALANYFDWKTESPKLWHRLPQSKGHLTPKAAVLYQEIIRLGGSENFYAILMENEAYQIDLLTAEQQARNFWYSIVRWFIRHDGELVGTENTRVLTWARHQYTEFLREQKVFSMNGRSLSKVIRSANDYHRAVLAREAELARRAEARRLARLERQAAQRQEYEEIIERRYASEYDDENYSWKARGWDKEYQYDNGKWQFVELTNSKTLNKEAGVMQHCVASYGYECHIGDTTIFSLRKNGQRHLTIEIDPQSGTMLQAYGQYNRDPSAIEMKLIKRWRMDVVLQKTRSKYYS